MPLFQASYLFVSILFLLAVTGTRRLHPFLAIVAAAAGFGLAAGLSTGLLGKAFGLGFSQSLDSPGLVIVAAGLVGALAEDAGASRRLAAAADIGRWRLGAGRIAALVGLSAGTAASPAAAFALLMPVFGVIGGETGDKRKAATLRVALAISAGHGLVLPSPVLIAAAAILGAGWSRVALFGVPAAVIATAAGALLLRLLPSDPVLKPDFGAETVPPEPGSAAARRGGGSGLVLLLATAVPLLMLIIRSFGDMPSEPLGGGPAREMLLGIGRPFVLLLAGLGIMFLGHWRQWPRIFAETGWTARALANLSEILLILGAAGGLQRLCQETGMAELLGAELLGEPLLGSPCGILLPFLVAAAIKTLQGSSSVAAIAAAGMVQPLLPSLGLGAENGRALAALAIGAGAMTVCHVNDPFFWLVSDRAGLHPLRGLGALAGGTLLQGLAACAALFMLSLLVPAFRGW
jgi:gluconate:H+ symporter, GntP family